MEAAQRYLEAKERHSVGSRLWADATAMAFDLLRNRRCAEAVKPEWWNDEALKALSARVVRAAPNDTVANTMRAAVLSGTCAAWEVEPRSAAEIKKATTRTSSGLRRCPMLRRRRSRSSISRKGAASSQRPCSRHGAVWGR